MSAPEWYWDRLEKFRDLARADADMKAFKLIQIFATPGGTGINTGTDLPCLMLIPTTEVWRTYSTALLQLEVGLRLSVRAYLDLKGKPDVETKRFLKLTAETARFVWRNKTVQDFWWMIQPQGPEFIRWDYAQLQEADTGRLVLAADCDIRLRMDKIDLTE